jgi:AcrR family transcriptional regulator
LKNERSRKPPRKAAPSRGQTLGREAWISLALDALSEEGIEGVRVELLARKLGITKGSFYHHFSDRDDLYAAMLEYWRRHNVIEVIADLKRTADPRERFHRLLRLPFDDKRADPELEFSVRQWARRDARAFAALREVDTLRLDFLRSVMRLCGVPSSEARARAVLTLALLRGAPCIDKTLLTQCERLLIGA